MKISVRAVCAIVLVIALALAAMLKLQRMNIVEDELRDKALLKVSDVADQVILWQADHSGKLPSSLSLVNEKHPLGDLSGMSYKLIDGGKNFRINYFDEGTNTLIVADQRGLCWPVTERPKNE